MEEIHKQKPAHRCSLTPDFRSTLNKGEPGRWFGPCGTCWALGRLTSAGRQKAGSVLQAPRAWETQISVSEPEHPWALTPPKPGSALSPLSGPLWGLQARTLSEFLPQIKPDT